MKLWTGAVVVVSGLLSLEMSVGVVAATPCSLMQSGLCWKSCIVLGGASV